MTSSIATLPADDEALIETCRQKSLELLRTNLSPQGILAATPGARADARGYAAIFGRDAAVCAIGMALSGDALLEREAATGLVTLAEYQATNGQIPKFVDLGRHEPDFWYLGCIDATLWWLIALDCLDGRDPAGALRQRLAPNVAKAIQWLEAQEHQRFFLLQQNEASDWADIMPRSGFVLYTNALWYCVKQLYGLARIEETRANFNQLFHPFSAALPEYRRARLLTHYVKREAKHRDLYLSFVNFSFFGEEGDVFGNVLALLCGLADGEAARRTLRALDRARIAEPWPVRVVCEPIPAGDPLWRAYMSAAPAEPRVAIPQRRHLAVRRRLLGRCAGAGGRRRQGARGTGEARGRQCTRRLGVQRVAAWPHFGAARHARPVLECRCFSHRPGRRAQRRCGLRAAAAPSRGRACRTAATGKVTGVDFR